MTTTTLVPSAPSAKSAVKIPVLKTDNPEEVTAQFKASFEKARGALQVVLAFGVYAAHVKYNLLKHSQFGDWVKATCGEPAYRSVRSYIQLTEGVLKACGVKSLKAQLSKWQQLPICHSGNFLLIPDAEVPKAVQPLREKILDTIKNKTQRQLFFEFKQADEDEESNAPKRGRRKGEGGASKEQRLAAAQAEEKARITALELDAKDWIKWVDKNCDAEGFGKISDSLAIKLEEAARLALDFLRPLNQARKGGAK